MNETRHCESCGSRDYEDINLGDQGYTACCNELVCDCTPRDGSWRCAARKEGLIK